MNYYDVVVIDHRELRIRRGSKKREMSWDDEFYTCEGEAGLREHMSDCGHEEETIDEIVRQAKNGEEDRWTDVQV